MVIICLYFEFSKFFLSSYITFMILFLSYSQNRKTRGQGTAKSEHFLGRRNSGGGKVGSPYLR
jgi:hypothetical protein